MERRWTWTDEQDDIAYDTFRTYANHHGIEAATNLMCRIITMGADFLNRDIEAWEARYMDEDDWRQEQADQERAADEFVFRNSTI